MGLITCLLCKLSEPACTAYRCGKLAFKLTKCFTPLRVIEKGALFALGDINGRSEISIAVWAVTFIINKVRNARAGRRITTAVREADTNKNQVVELAEVEALLASKAADPSKRLSRSEAVERAALHFLRYCLQRFDSGDADTLKRFGKPAAADDDANAAAAVASSSAKIVLNAPAVVASFLGTTTCQQLAQEILDGAGKPPGSLDALMEQGYSEIVHSLRDDAIDLLVL